MYIVRSQGYSGGPEFKTLREAEKRAAEIAREDLRDARRAWKSAFLAREKGEGYNFWEVRAGKDERKPRWSLVSVSKLP